MSIETLTEKILLKMPKCNRPRFKFMQHVFWLILSMRNRINFANMERQGGMNESSYRNNFSIDFDFLEFNQHLVSEVCSNELILAFDPCYISKSGKNTPGVGFFWSGVAGRAKHGLELGGLAAIDLKNNTAMHLLANQTVDLDAGDSLIDFYAKCITKNADQLLKIAKVIAVDAYFPKRNFVDPAVASGFTVVSRLRRDAYLRYAFEGEQRKGRGRPKEYDGQVDIFNLNMAYFKQIHPTGLTNKYLAYEAKVHIRSLKRWVKAVVVHRKDESGKIKAAKIYFSTDLRAQGLELLKQYNKRFQIEFLYRDAKQFAGLEQCQSRKKERLHFHFNLSLTAVSLAKALHHLTVPIINRKPFSMSSVKTQYFNELLLERFFLTFADIPKPQKNSAQYQSLAKFASIAA